MTNVLFWIMHGIEPGRHQMINAVHGLGVEPRLLRGTQHISTRFFAVTVPFVLFGSNDSHGTAI